MTGILEQVKKLYSLKGCDLAMVPGHEGEGLDYEDIEHAAECLINGIPYAGFGE